MNKITSWLLFPMTGGLPHEEVRGLASDYVDGSLSGSIAARFRWHVRMCRDCNRFVATLRATIRTLRDLPRSPAPPGLQDRIRSRIEREARQGE